MGAARIAALQGHFHHSEIARWGYRRQGLLDMFRFVLRLDFPEFCFA